MPALLHEWLRAAHPLATGMVAPASAAACKAARLAVAPSKCLRFLRGAVHACCGWGDVATQQHAPYMHLGIEGCSLLHSGRGAAQPARLHVGVSCGFYGQSTAGADGVGCGVL
jgi:hypothetical protein